jgi:CBS domain-containing protein
MRVSEVMTRGVQIGTPDMTIRDAARMMAELDAGSLPIGENDRLVGMLTDRDITIRAVGEGKGPDCPVREVMSPEILYCFEDQDVDEVARSMSESKVRRMPVLNRDKRLIGILSLGDLARCEEMAAGHTMAQVAQPGGQHSQTLH